MAVHRLVQAAPRSCAHHLAAFQLRRAIFPSLVAPQSSQRSTGRALHTASGQNGWKHGESGGAWSMNAWAGIAALGGSLALFTSGKVAHAAEQMHTHVYERETGIEYPRSISAPPFVPSRWKGGRPGFVYKNGAKGLGYYMDRYRGKLGYVDIPEDGVTQHLVGVGMRCMLQRCDIHLARAYAIGLYLDHSYVAGFEPAKLTDPRLRKTLRLVMAREVKGPHIAKGFDRTLIPKMREKTGSKQGPGKEALRTFANAFNRCGTLEVGAEVLFVFGGDDTVSVYIQNVPAARIESAALCEAVMEMYVGGKPVGPLIKANIVEGYDKVAETGLGKVEDVPGTQLMPLQA